MNKLIVILGLVFVFSDSHAGVNDRRALFNTMTKNINWSGCYSIGRSVQEYESCMNEKKWELVENDILYLEDRCKLLDSSDKEKPVCFSVAASAGNKKNAALIQAAQQDFRTLYDSSVIEEHGMCYQPEIEHDVINQCVADSGDLESARLELRKMKSLHFRALNLTSFNGSKQDEHLRLAIGGASIIVENKSRAEDELREEEKRKQLEQFRAELDAADKRELEKVRSKEHKRKELCGDDYGNIRVGMTRKRMIQCVAVTKMGERSDGIELYRMGNGTLINIVNGKVESWIIQ